MQGLNRSPTMVSNMTKQESSQKAAALKPDQSQSRPSI